MPFWAHPDQADTEFKHVGHIFSDMDLGCNARSKLRGPGGPKKPRTERNIAMEILLFQKCYYF